MPPSIEREKRFTDTGERPRVVSRAGDSQAGQTIVGYAAVFYRSGKPGTEYLIGPDTYERIRPVAFDRAIREDDIAGLFNHDPNMLLGRSGGTMKLIADSIGLRYEITSPTTSAGQDVVKMLRRGDLRGSSFSFIPDKVEWSKDGNRTIRWIDAGTQLFDVGPVTFPAYQDSKAGLRSGLFCNVGSADVLRQSDRLPDFVTTRMRILEIEAAEDAHATRRAIDARMAEVERTERHRPAQGPPVTKAQVTARIREIDRQLAGSRR